VHDGLTKNNKYRQLIGFPLLQDLRRNLEQRGARVRRRSSTKTAHRVLAAMKSALFGSSFVLRFALILLTALRAHAKFGFFPSQEHPNPPDAFGNRHPYWGVFLVFGILALNLLFFLRLGKDISQRVRNIVSFFCVKCVCGCLSSSLLCFDVCDNKF
jgi:hypothetical protein